MAVVSNVVVDKAGLVRCVFLCCEATLALHQTLTLNVICEATERCHLVGEEAEALTVLVSLRFHLLTAVHGMLEGFRQLVIFSLQCLVLLQYLRVLSLHFLVRGFCTGSLVAGLFHFTSENFNGSLLLAEQVLEVVSFLHLLSQLLDDLTRLALVHLHPNVCNGFLLLGSH